MVFCIENLKKTTQAWPRYTNLRAAKELVPPKQCVAAENLSGFFFSGNLVQRGVDQNHDTLVNI